MHTANLSDNERSNSFLDEKTTRSVIKRHSAEKDISDITLKNKVIKPIFDIGPHKVLVIDKQIVEKLNIYEGYFCEQQVSKEGDIILKILRIENV